MKKNNCELLKQIKLFTDLDPESFTELMRIMRRIDMESDTILFRQGDISDGMYIIGEGSVRIVSRSAGDELIDLARLGPGELLGELALIKENKRSATAITSGLTSLYFLSNHHLELLRLDSRPLAGLIIDQILKTICTRIREVLRKIAAMPLLRNDAPQTPFQMDTRRSGKTPEVFTPDRNQLKSIPFFRRFINEDLIDPFLAPLSQNAFSRGEEILKENGPPEKCYIIVRGAVRLSIERQGRDEAMWIEGPGGIVGDISLMDGGNQPMLATVCSDSTLLGMEGPLFHKLQKDHSLLATHFFEGIRGSIFKALHRSDRNLARLTAHERLLQPVRNS